MVCNGHNSIGAGALSLKQLQASTEDYTRAIDIYEDRFEGKMRVKAETITQMVCGETEDREVLPYGLYSDGRVVGFCLLTLYKKERFVYADYISIAKDVSSRSIGAAFNIGARFLLLMGEEVKRLTNTFVLFEAGHAALVRVYKSLGAGIVDCEHIMPVLDMTLERVPGKVAIFPKPESIGKDRYLECLKTILFKGYAEWVTPSLCPDDAARYIEYITGIYDELKGLLPEEIYVI
ncbi:MAG: hypothetical protein FWG72_08070 [Oscillospiraceae bacterium]|nr:hypothetical protein [Oscillospiraceae bacterium]